MSRKIKKIRMIGTLLRWGSRAYRRLILLFDNRKIRSKVFYVYLLCVLVPVLATNTVIIASMLRSARIEQKEIAKRIADSVEHSIVSALDSAVYITIDLFTNKSVYKFLDMQYTRSTDYYSEYSAISQSYMFSGTTKELIKNMTLFSDNSTMINGGKFFRINEVRDMDWYQKLHKQDSDLLIYSNYNDTYYANNFRRQINVIRKLNFMGTRSNEKIVSIEMNYNAIEEVFKNSALESTVYICEGSKVLFSNDRSDRGEMQEFLNTSCIDRNDIQLHKRVHLYG
ncbi:MAG TPA: hypothetical protein VHQ24_09060, partial [Lachnospiraceae bacterium]|nr:hypothetical protein [Lachnospiraceae bacterium]